MGAGDAARSVLGLSGRSSGDQAWGWGFVDPWVE